MAKLEYEFSVVGVANVERALASLERRFAQHNANVNRTFGGPRRLPASGASGVGRQIQTAEQRRHAIEMRNAERAARLRDRLEERNIAKQQRAQQVYWDRARKQSDALRHREHRQSIALQERMFNRRRESIARHISGGVSGVGGAIKGVGAVAGGLVGIGGTAIAASAISQAMRLDEMTRRLSITGRGKGEQGVDPKEMAKQFTQTGIALGFAPEDIAEGAAQFTAKTGDLDTALKNQAVFATVAQGAGAKIQEVFSAAADLSSKMDVSSVEKMSEAFAILSIQGKKGGFELKAMASEFPEILAAAASAGVKGIGGVRDVGALMQIARSATGGDSEATTAVNTVFRQLAAKASDIQSGKALSGKKVEVFEGGDATKPMRNFVDVVSEVIAASGGNLTQMQDIFDVRGIKAVNPMLRAYREATDTTLKSGGSKKEAQAAGKQAIANLFSGYRDVEADYAEVQRDAADAMKSFSVQMEILNTKLKDAISSQLFPELVKLGPELAKLVPYVSQATASLVSFVQWFAEEPYKGLATVIGAAFTAQIGKAVVSNAIVSGMSSLLASITAIVSGNAVAGGAAKAAAAGTGAAVAGGAVGALAAATVAAAPGVARIAVEGTRTAANEEYSRFGAGFTDPHADMPKVGFIDALSQLFSGELTAVAEKQTAAADKLASAADKLAAAKGPNTGNSPSSVK